MKEKGHSSKCVQLGFQLGENSPELDLRTIDFAAEGESRLHSTADLRVCSTIAAKLWVRRLIVSFLMAGEGKWPFKMITGRGHVGDTTWKQCCTVWLLLDTAGYQVA